jgi:hypothetical protein
VAAHRARPRTVRGISGRVRARARRTDGAARHSRRGRPLRSSLTHSLNLISHRFSSVRHAERIVLLDEGRIVEDGTHAELVAAGGLYATMFRHQARHFDADG